MQAKLVFLLLRAASGLGLLALCATTASGQTPTYTLPDFGYQHPQYNGPSPRPLPIGQRPCLVVLLDTAKNGHFLHNTDWYYHAVFDVAGQPYYLDHPINSYFLENSCGRFFMTATSSGVIGPVTLTDAEQATFDYAASHSATVSLTSTLGKLAVSAALRQGFPLADYDTNNDGTVDYSELIVMPVSTSIEDGTGQTRGGDITPAGSPKTVTARVSSVGPATFESRPATVAHELTHNVANMYDLYYYAAVDYLGHSVHLNEGFTVAADFVQVNLDPFEKMTAGWNEPRLVPMHQSGRFYLKAAQLSDPASPLLLYDPVHGNKEFFMMEFRNAALPGYDVDFIDFNGKKKGVVLWHITTNDNHDAIITTSPFGLTPENNAPNAVWVEGAPYAAKPEYIQPNIVWYYGQQSEHLRWWNGATLTATQTPMRFHVEDYTGDENGVWVDILGDALGDNTWTGNAGSNGTGEWTNGGNWTGGVPSENFAVMFGASTTTNIHTSFKTYAAGAYPPLLPFSLHTLTFAAGAPAYRLTLASDIGFTSGGSIMGSVGSLDLVGQGVVNLSGVTQTFLLAPTQAVIGANADTEDFLAQPATMDFHNEASAGTLTAYDVPGGSVTRITHPGVTDILLRSPGNSITFHDHATAAGSTVFLRGGDGNGSFNSSLTFRDASTAGAATVTAEGGLPGQNFINATPYPCDGTGGAATFYDTANAGTAHFTTLGESRGTGGTGGFVVFNGQSNGGSATITNTGAGYGGGYGGQTYFQGASSAGSAVIANSPATTGNGGGSFTRFNDTSSAGNATISNSGTADVGFAPGGTTVFRNQTTAAQATFNNYGVVAFGARPGEIDFYDTSTAANAILKNFRALNAGGIIKFFDQSTADRATIINGDPEPQNLNASYLGFFNNSTAGTAVIANSIYAGTIEFYNSSTASRPSGNPINTHSVISLRGQADNNSRLQFWDTSSAANTVLTLRGALCFFYGHSTAGQAFIDLQESGYLKFSGDAPSGNDPLVSAGTAVVNASGGANNFNPAAILFNNWSTADHAVFSLYGGAAGYYGARVEFRGNSKLANGTFILYGSEVGGAGASGEFFDSASGDNARLGAYGGPYASGGAYFDFEQRYNSGVPVSVGSIEGDGGYYLRGAALTVGSLNTDTVVTGGLYDDTRTGGTLTKVGTGTLALNGVNTYTGDTTVSQGALSVGGSIKGNVIVQNGATLKGSGNVLGTLTADSGSTVAPGNSPGTLTAATAALSPLAALEIKCAATAGDKFVVTGDAQIAGQLNLKLLPGATVAAFNREIIVVGGAFNSTGMRIGSVPAGLSAADFSFTVANGHVSLRYGSGASSGTYSFFTLINFTPAQQADPTVSGPTADPDHDGIPNALEYALGLDPNASSNGALLTGGIQPASASPGAPKVMTLTFSVPQNPPSDATLTVVQGNSLAAPATWTVLATRNNAGVWTASGGGSVSQSVPANGRIVVTVFGSLPVSTTPQAFLRLGASVP